MDAPVTTRAVVRPAREDDVGALLHVAASLGSRLTTLPPEAGNLQDRVELSLRSFDPRIRTPGAEYYLLVLEDATTGRVMGTSALMGRVGGFEPSYTYEVRTEHFAHAPLGIATDHRVLHLRREHKGPSEIGGLALHPAARGEGLGRLLSLARFLFVQAHPHRFSHRFIAEIRGWVDEEGRSPFWEAVGRHFFARDLAEADLLSGLGDKTFIEDLVPRHPLYAGLLPAEAQEVIGRVHRDSRAARALLEAEGFTALGEVDIFDAGPVLHAPTAGIRTIRTARTAAVRVIAGPPEGPIALVATRDLDFRACLAPVRVTGDAVDLDAATARLLRVGEGDEVTVAPLRGKDLA